MTLQELKDNWQDNPEYHSEIKEQFDNMVNSDKELKKLRDWVEANHFGFGERCFYWMWMLIVQEQAKDFVFGEVGVFRSQTLALIRLLSDRCENNAMIIGITPLDNTDGHWDSDYEKDVKIIHDQFFLERPKIIKGLSTDVDVIFQAKRYNYDIMYIDGGHTYDVVKSDLEHYPEMVKVGGLLVIDDATNDLHMEWGFFQGIEDVTRATLEWHEANKDRFEFQFNVVHNRVFKRIK